MKKNKQQKGILKCVLNLDEKLFKDKEINTGTVVWDLLTEAVDMQLQEKKRRIAKVKNPIKLSIEIKTAKI